jgi:hypothetical protein
MIRDMRSESAIQHGKNGQVFLVDRVHVGAINNGPSLLLVSHFLRREGMTEDILGHPFPSPFVPAFDSDLIMDISLNRPGEVRRCRIDVPGRVDCPHLEIMISH